MARRDFRLLILTTFMRFMYFNVSYGGRAPEPTTGVDGEASSTENRQLEPLCTGPDDAWDFFDETTNPCFARGFVDKNNGRGTKHPIQPDSYLQRVKTARWSILRNPFPLCTLAAVRVPPSKAIVVNCTVFFEESSQAWFINVQGGATCDVMCLYQPGLMRSLKPNQRASPTIADSVNSFEVFARDIEDGDNPVFVTERDRVQMESRVCGLTAMDTTMKLQAKGSKVHNGYCKLTANEWRYEILASPAAGKASTTCRSMCTSEYRPNNGGYVPRGVYLTGPFYKTLNRFGTVNREDDGEHKSLALCFLSHVNIQPSKSPLSRGCNVTLDYADDSTALDRREWSLRVIGDEKDRSVICSALCICQMSETNFADSDQPWCIPPIGIAKANNVPVAFAIQRMTIPVPNERAVTASDIAAVVVIVTALTVLLVLYLWYHKMRSMLSVMARGLEAKKHDQEKP